MWYKEKHKELKEQMKMDKRINLSMLTVLENKVSELLAENELLKENNSKL